MKILAALGLLLASSTPLPAAPTTGLDVDIVGFNSAVHTPGTDLAVSIEVTNPSSSTVTGHVNLALQATVPVARDTLTEWMAGSNLFLSPIATDELELQPGTRTYTVRVDRSAIPWGNTMESWGPRGLEASVTLESDTVSDRSLLVIGPSYDLPPMSFTTIVPVTTSARDLAALPSVSDMVEDNVTDGIRDHIGEVATSAAARLAPTIRTLGADGISLALDSALASADYGSLDETKEALRNFSGQKRDLLLLPAFDANLAQWTTPILDPIFTPQVEAIASAKTDLAAEKISARSDVLVPADSLTASLASRASTLSMDVLVGSISDAALTDELYWTPSAVTSFGGAWPATGILADDDMNEVLRSPAVGAGDQLDKRQLLLAMTAVHYRERPNDPRPFVLSLERDSTVTPAEIVSLVHTLDSASWLEATDLSTIAATPVTTFEREPLTDKSPADTRVSPIDLQDAVHARSAIASFARVTTTPEAYTEPVDALMSSLLSHAWSSVSASRYPGITGLTDLQASLTGSITAQESSTINIISQATELPVRIASDLPTEAAVTVRLTSSDRRLQFTPTDAMLAPGTTTTVMVPVKAVGSGNVSVTIDVTDTAGLAIGQPATIDVRVRADWESMGTAVLAGGFLVILIFGIVRSAKKGTRTQPMDESVAEKERMKQE